jgi:GDP-4-dehydro-6-deoxy-D-mannose reductase
MLHEGGWTTWGVDRRQTLEEFAGEEYVACDLQDEIAVERVLDRVRPEFIVHLAAQSSAGRSFAEPALTIRNNVIPVLNILDYVRKRQANTRLLAVGSADIYGPVEEDILPLQENRSPNPVNAYALSKSLQEQCCRQYASLYEIDVVATRSFNHTGHGQTEVFVLSSFAKQIVEIKKGLREPVVEVGNTEVRRDFLDVTDVCRAYLALLEKGRRGEVYNVCSGTSHSVRELLETLCRLADVKLRTDVKDNRLRATDIRELRGDNSKIKADTGWTPEIPLEDTLQSLLDYWDREIR